MCSSCSAAKPTSVKLPIHLERELCMFIKVIFLYDHVKGECVSLVCLSGF